ncbi:hypothetical protein CVT26_012849 [Gymnopilus dilepis]|uniref:ATP-dependent DNA helicase n=1 Tax=Gymnopilus dilepis TaxID=231916 RepID=A0A409Y469_9AGAR|nr:hypothetical protein CVT26_012849 [Gymnopilus dilepis]
MQVLTISVGTRGQSRIVTPHVTVHSFDFNATSHTKIHGYLLNTTDNVNVSFMVNVNVNVIVNNDSLLCNTRDDLNFWVQNSARPLKAPLPMAVMVIARPFRRRKTAMIVKLYLIRNFLRRTDWLLRYHMMTGRMPGCWARLLLDFLTMEKVIVQQQARPLDPSCIQLATRHVGGGPARPDGGLTGADLAPYTDQNVSEASKVLQFRFRHYYTNKDFIPSDQPPSEFRIYARFPLSRLLPYLNKNEIRTIANYHGVVLRSKWTRSQMLDAIPLDHNCTACQEFIASFECLLQAREKVVTTSQDSVPRARCLSIDEICQFGLNVDILEFHEVESFEYEDYVPYDRQLYGEGRLLMDMPLHILAEFLSRDKLIQVCRQHGVFVSARTSLSDARKTLSGHVCLTCPLHVAIWKSSASSVSERFNFPPPPLSMRKINKVLTDCTNELTPGNIEESGCAVCGSLVANKHQLPFDKSHYNLEILKSDYSRKERKSFSDPIAPLDGPLIDEDCSRICQTCDGFLRKGTVPPAALANGFWIGKVPEELQGLTFGEEMLIARVRHNRCVVRVASGRVKMCANVIMFANPTPILYNVLPPPRSDLDEVLAFVYMGSSYPTQEDAVRTPLLVRRNKVARALEWLRLNHSDYFDLKISAENLMQYPEYGVPFSVDYKQTDGASNKNPLAMSVDDNEVEEGSESGPCPFTVHGLTGAEYSTMSAKALKAVALRHLQLGGKVLGVGKESMPESMYDNPQSYPKMFPWLFPYGFGGIGQRIHKGKWSSMSLKRKLLMYWDKRFQTDTNFPIVAFCHEQLKSSIDGSFLAAKRQKFKDVAERLARLNPITLSDLTQRMIAGEKVTPQTDDEKACFSLLNDIDHMGGHVRGSTTTKKQRRNELWSLMAFKGAPLWFITFSPVDSKHPLCLYYAGTKLDWNPQLPSGSAERYQAIAQNPVAAARFFHFMVNAFIKHILGMRSEGNGIFGQTDAYFGMVEQQGRLTLHLHILIWIANALSPQDMRERLTSGDTAFQQALVSYLESCRVGELYSGNVGDPIMTEVDDSHDPTLLLPPKPRPMCSDDKCQGCQLDLEFEEQFRSEVDAIARRSNVHSCRVSAAKVGSNVQAGPKGCITKYNECSARFPRPVYSKTVVDEHDGHIDLKKQEPMMNDFSPVLAYFMRGNTDTTSLLSGTAVKAVMHYVSDYLTKLTTKTHHIFEAAKVILLKNREQTESPTDSLSNGRRTLLKIVNSLSTKLELGSPFASLYLLGNPDHYVSHTFVPFYWRTFVNYVSDNIAEGSSSLGNATDEENEEGIPLEIGQSDGRYFERSRVHDYIYRPKIYDRLPLWNWIQGHTIRKRTPKELAIFKYCLQKTGHNIPDIELDEGEVELVPKKFVEMSADAIKAHTDMLLRPSFLCGHPMFLTHCPVFSASNLRLNVPNILGGSLPRSDIGDREFYSKTMLVLFKPWRDPSGLRDGISSWTEAFNLHCFTTRQVTLMKNFNLRYECLDARDDFQAKRKLNESTAFLANFDLQKLPEPNQDPDYSEDEDDGKPLQLRDKLHKAFTFACNRYVEKLRAMTLADSILSSVGLLDFQDPPSNEEEGNEVGVTNNSPCAPHLNFERRSPSAWKNCIKSMRAAIIRQTKSVNRQATLALNGLPPDYINKPTADVKLLDSSYFLHDFKARTSQAQQITDKIAQEAQLNKEQDRAFRIVANHAASLAPEQLKMYIGGMAGTGKSRVVHALKKYFEDRGESGRYVIVAPTGTAAAQLNGFTYHSLLGINEQGSGDNGRGSAAALRESQERLNGVDYLIFDEVSMVAENAFYKISARLCEIRNNSHEIFGGMNVIILGDFAQLSPVFGSPLYDGSTTFLAPRSKVRDQEDFLGRAIWHQFTTVIMLTQNMRQLKQSPRDKAFRRCLTNMRYCACDEEDLAFLDSLIVKDDESASKPLDHNFRHAAIITSFNAFRDRINDVGVERFAREHNETVHHFYSEDSIAEFTIDAASKRKKKYIDIAQLSPAIQEKLWNLPVGNNDQHVAGKLTLCRGLPVLIRNNDATELCITKGQDAVVVDWDSKKLPSGHDCLQTLYVRLVNPPRRVQIEGLPENVVPLPSKVYTSLSVETPSGEHVLIKRSQVPVLPYFAMTEYTSQGKTRPWNLVHLMNCRNHQAIYTALSRGATADGTAIIGGYDPKKITGKDMSGHLRQEFRELEILNKMTELRYHKLIPENAVCDLRNPTIKNYYALRGQMEGLELSLHKALQAETDEDCYKDSGHPELDTVSINQNFVSENLQRKRGIKRKIDGAPAASKRLKTSNAPPELALQTPPRGPAEPDVLPKKLTPRGPIWDSVNYSCAYDSIIFILYNLWMEGSESVRSEIISRWPLLNFELCGHQLNEYRDHLRMILHSLNSAAFPNGNLGADVLEVIGTILHDASRSGYAVHCPTCLDTFDVPHETLSPLVYPLPPDMIVPTSLSKQLGDRLAFNDKCPACHTRLVCRSPTENREIPASPPIRVIPLRVPGLKVDKKIELPTCEMDYVLKGVVYFGDFHFTARFLDNDGVVWFHDGMKGSNARHEGSQIGKKELDPYCNGHVQSLAIYVRQDLDLD